MAGPYSGPLEADLEPDFDMIRDHLKFAFSNMFFGMIEIGWNNPATGALNQFARFDVDHGIDEAAEFVAEINSVPGQSAYFRPAVIKPLEDDGVMVNDSHFLRSGLAWADLDTPEAVQNARVAASACDYNAYVITGLHPHPRVQCYWKMKTDDQYGQHAADDLRADNKALAVAMNSDGAVTNPSTLMRVGGTIAWPWKPGRVPELTKFAIKEQDRVDMPQFFAFVRKTERTSAAVIKQDPYAGWDQAGGGAGLGISSGVNIERCLAEARSGKNWHNNLLVVTANQVTRGLSDGEIIAVALTTTLHNHGYTETDTRREVETMIRSARAKWEVPAPDTSVEMTPEPRAELELSRGNFSTVDPPVPFIYGKIIARGYLTVVAAPGGTGKTALATAIATAMISGQRLLHDAPKRALRVSYWNLEDPQVDMRRRFRGVFKRYSTDGALTGDDWKDWRDPDGIKQTLWLNSGQDRALALAALDDNRSPRMMPDADKLIEKLHAEKADVLFIDPPLNAYDSLPENDNQAMNFAAKLLARVAREVDCAVVLIVHTRKGFVSGEADSVRGATAIVNAARFVLTLAQMTEDEAKVFSVPEAERRRFIRVDDAKMNLKPPAMKTDWLELVGVDLEDAREIGEESSNIQVATPWTPPDPNGDFSGEMAERVLRLMKEREGTERHTRTMARKGGRPSRENPVAVFQEVADDMPGDVKPPRRDGVLLIVEDWLANGTLEAINQDGARDEKIGRNYPAAYRVLNVYRSDDGVEFPEGST